MKKLIISPVTMLIVIMFSFNSGIAKNNSRNQRKAQKTSSSQISSARIDINNLNALESNVGFSDYNLNSNLDGTEFPKGSGKSVIYETGLLWGGLVTGDSQPRIGGSAYTTGLEPGPILSDGYPSDPADPKYKIYRVRRDVYPGGPAVDLSSEAALEGISQSTLRTQYENDWTNWPAAGTSNDLGAPFTDVNKDGLYESNIDIPGVPGADQTIYYVANDEDPSLTATLYGTQPLGIELHATYWAYNDGGPLGNTYFKKYMLINKGYQKNQINNMFISLWADPDLGSNGDDFPGTDTTLNLIYTYNGNPFDAVYTPSVPPSVGFTLLQGPMVNGIIYDTALFNGQKIPGKKNLGMTGSYFFCNDASSIYNDPPIGTPLGSTAFYNFFNGKYGVLNLPFQDPQGHIYKYVFPGDPVAGTGWIADQTITPSDIRQGLVSGPFNFAPGDTQEVVLAEFAGEGTDYLHSIYTVKDYQFFAQNAYKNLINGIITPSPSSPVMTLSNNNNSIQIQWDKSTESFNQAGYSFEGYNIYQLSSSLDSKESAKLIATYDIIDGLKTIYGVSLNPQNDQVTNKIQQYGNDTGLQYSFTTAKDYINNTPFIKGENYYYAVTAYALNPTTNAIPNNTESNFQPGVVDYNYNLPGANFGDQVQVTHIAGLSDAVVNATVSDPSKLTGHKYQVSFHDEKYSLGSSGEWTDITSPNKKLSKVTDLTGSSLTNAAAWGENGQIILHYLVNVVSPNYDYCDGVVLKLPLDVKVNSIHNIFSNNNGGNIPYTYNASTNTIFFGDSAKTTNGYFTGGEDIIIEINTPSLPLTTNYTMYDDNWGDSNGYPGSLININSSVTLTTISDQLITQHQWNVTDLSTGNVVLKNQTIFSGYDIYAPNYYFASNQTYGPGGSSGDLNGYVGILKDSISDGIRVDVNGNFSTPVGFGNITLNDTALNSLSKDEWKNTNYDISDFIIFGYPNGTAEISLPFYGGIGGTSSVYELQQDYELRWTGVLGKTVVNGDTVIITKSGGSMATIFGAHNYSLANHPLNPGVNHPFLIRIPFEVWNTTKNEQVNLLIYDRMGNWPSNDFQVWNTNDRMYAWVLNTKYNPTAEIDPASTIVSDSATWNWVFFASRFKTGDDMKIKYINPIQVGIDTYTFTVPNGISAVKKDDNKIKSFSLSQNYPNPFNPTTTINYTVPKSSLVKIKVYDILGREVETLLNEQMARGNYSVEFNAGKLASGVYFYRMQADNFVSTKKLLLLK